MDPLTQRRLNAHAILTDGTYDELRRAYAPIGGWTRYFLVAWTTFSWGAAALLVWLRFGG